MKKQIYLTLLLLVMIAGPLAAQEGPAVNCGDLSEADCTLYRGAVTLPASVQHPLLEVSTSYNGAGYFLSGTGATEFSNNRPLQLDWQFENGPRMMVVADQLYWQDFAEGPWVETSDLSAATEFVNLILGNIGQAPPQRLADADWNGQTLAVFSTSPDVESFIGQDFILQIMANVVDVDAGTLQQSLPLIMSLMDTQTASSSLWVGPEDGLLYRFEYSLQVGLDVPSVVSDVGRIDFSMRGEIQFAEHGQPLTFAAPEGEISPNEAGFFSPDEFVAPPSPEFSIDIQGELSFDQALVDTSSAEQVAYVYSFQGLAGQVVSLTGRKTDVAADLDLSLLLLDGQGQELARNFDHSSDSEDLAPSDSQILAFELPADGPYYVVISWANTPPPAEFEIRLMAE
jgi:hypothetical protein